MHSFAPHALVALAVSALVASVPMTSSTTPFSFVQWVDDIIANHDGDHLSPEEAVAKKAAESSHPVVKRANCNQNFPRAEGNGAAYCLGYLAGLGSKGVNCSLEQNQNNVQMWRQGNAKIVGVKTTAPAVGVNCGEVARVGGLIFDSCWTADNTVMGSEVVAGGLYQVNVLGA